MTGAEIKYYQNIPGLMAPKTVQYEIINSDINKYIDAIPNLTEKLGYNFLNMRYDYAIKNLEAIIVLLENVYARWLETEGTGILRKIKLDDKPALKKTIKSFISDLTLLSIEMQRAQSLKDKEEAKAISKLETHAGMANNLSAVGKLIDGGEYEKAQNMITELDEYNPANAFNKLLGLITAKKYGEAEAFANILKEEHIEAINQFAESGSSKKILAVDDRPEMLSFISGALKKHYKVFGVTGGNAALKVLGSQSFDLFILDIDMPEMDGYELAKIIRATSGYEHTPIIFLTGNSSREHVMKAIEAGCNDFIVKPASHEILLAKVGKF